jgi:hypothetical protein
LDYRFFEVSKRELIFDVFEDELRQLHKAGFVHRDLRRLSNVGFDNNIQKKIAPFQRTGQAEYE